MSTQILTELPNIQYAGMDYENVVAEIKKIIKDNPDWAENWEEFYSSEAGMVFIQLMAWICDNLSTRQDVLYNEQYLSTAKKKSSKIRLLKSIGYKPSLSHASQVPLKFEFDNFVENETYIIENMDINTPLSLRINQIPKLNGLDKNGETTSWEILSLKNDKPNYLNGISIKSGQSLYEKDSEDKNIYAIQGETKYKELTTYTNDGPYIDLLDKNIADNSIRVYDKETKKEFTEVHSFVSKEALDINKSIPYIIEYNENETIRIKFPPKNTLSEKRLLPAKTTICVFYRITNGNLGNIPPKFINTSYSFNDLNGKRNKARIYNDLTAYNGSNSEELDNAVLNAPLTLRTLDRAVTPEDFDILLNKNTNIYKSKTYTASNIPENFKKVFGRYINPQEAFSFIMLNKNSGNIPSNEYNNFPWVSLIKEPMLNEKYSFSDGSLNEYVEISKEYYSTNVSLNKIGNLQYSNAIILNLGEIFNKKVSDNKLNENFKLKISKEMEKAEILSEIPYSLIKNDDDISSTTTYTRLIDENWDIKTYENSKFISKNSYNKEMPIDVRYARYIYLSLDKRTDIKIDLMSGKNEETINPKTWYLLWDNPYDGEESQDGKITTAGNRKGIIQLINDQLVALSTGSLNTENNIVDIYSSNIAYQYMGLQITDNEIISQLEEGAKRLDLILNIGNLTCRFVIINDPNNSYSDLTIEDNNQISYKRLVEILNNKLLNNNLYLLSNDKSQWYTVEEYNTEYETNYNFSSIVFGINSSLLLDIDQNQRDVYIKAGQNMQDDQKINISYENVLYPELDITIENISYDSVDARSLIHYMHKEIEDIIPYEDLLGANLKASNYSNLASTLEDKKNKENIYFQIKSPVEGIDSCIYFKEYPDIEKEDGNFIKDFLNVDFMFNGRTREAIGQKRITIIKEPVTNIYYIDNEGNKKELSNNPTVGNLIFQNSCIYNNYDFNNLYAFYQFNSVDKLDLGATYNNFYYTGDPIKDKEIKEKEFKFIKPSGVVIDEKGDIDKFKTNIEIKFTNNYKDVSSFYSIKTDLDIVSPDVASIKTISIPNLNSFAGKKLKFSIDDLGEDAWEIPINDSINNGNDLYDAIKDVIKNEKDTEEKEKISENVDGVISKNYDLANSICISGLIKINSMNGSRINFYSSGEPDIDKLLYKKILGTSVENSELYKLYPYDTISDENIVWYDDQGNEIERPEEITSNTVYSYYPGNETDGLVFKYRKLVNGESRLADYWISYSPSVEGNGSGKYSLNKYENSKFPEKSFYIHLINDRTGFESKDEENEKNKIKIDETDLNEYMENKKISGMDITWNKPFIKTYDIFGEVTYNPNFSRQTVKNDVEKKVKKLCSLDKAEINGYISSSQIIKEIMNCDGVENVAIHYFGEDQTKQGVYPNTQKIKSNFYEIACLADYKEKEHGLSLEFKNKE